MNAEPVQAASPLSEAVLALLERAKAVGCEPPSDVLERIQDVLSRRPHHGA